MEATTLNRAETLLRHARIDLARGDAAGCRGAIDEGLALVRGSDTPVEAGLLLVEAQLTAWTGDGIATLAAAERAAGVARRAKAFTAWSEYVLGQALYVNLSVDCLRHFERARARAAESGDGDLELEAWLTEAAALHLFGRSRESLEISVAVERLASERRKLIWKHLAAWMTARTTWLAYGDAEEAATAFRGFLDKRGLGLHRPQLLGDLALALADSGEADGARGIISSAARTAMTDWTDAASAYYRAEIEWASGRVARSLRVAEQQLEDGLPQSFEPLLRTTRLWCLYELDRPEDDPRIPTDSPALFAGAHHESAAFAALGAGDLDEGERHLLLAADAWHGNIMRNELRALWAAARTAVIHGDVRRGRTRLIELERRVSPLGLASILSRIRSSLRSVETGGFSRPRPTQPSARQQEILRLVGLGRSSRQIAADLGISPRTVESHVQTAMTTLGATTRIQATLLAGVAADISTSAVALAPDAPLLHLLATGKTVTEAAATLGISRRTATRRLEKSRSLLNTESNAEAVAAVARHAPIRVGA